MRGFTAPNLKGSDSLREPTKSSDHVNHGLFIWYPREESNLYHFLRTELLYPLSYRGLKSGGLASIIPCSAYMKLLTKSVIGARRIFIKETRTVLTSIVNFFWQLLAEYSVRLLFHSQIVHSQRTNEQFRLWLLLHHRKHE